VLRFAQIQAIAVLLEEAVTGSSSPEIVRLVPRRILHASRFLNACYAAFVDQQFAGALAAGLPFIQMGAMERRMKLFGVWEDMSRNLSPGGEYDLVDRFGDELHLEGWFAWIKDTGEPAPAQGPEGSTNPELLAIKSPAAVFYFLEILKRFDAMDPDAIKHVASEAAVAGREGLNYGSPEKKYQVPAYGPEVLSDWRSCASCLLRFNESLRNTTSASNFTTPTQKSIAMHEARKRGGS